MTDPRTDSGSYPALPERLLAPGEVAVLFGVSPKSVTRWSDKRGLPCIRTVGGHRRFRESDVRRLLEQGGTS